MPAEGLSKDIVLVGDPKVQDIPLGESHDPFVDVAQVAELDVDDRLASENPQHRLLRQGVVERLVLAAKALPAGYRFRVVEGYRPLSLQRRYFDAYVGELGAKHPEVDAASLEQTATRFVASPEGVAPHSTGGAVDLALGTNDGEQVDVGADVNDTIEASAGRCLTACTDLSPDAARHRKLLVDALTGAGLVNYPTEWWHWSYGEQYWAHQLGMDRTLYSPVEQPERMHQPRLG